MEIRKYKEEDVERVLEIWFESSSIAHDFLGLDQLKEQKNLFGILTCRWRRPGWWRETENSRDSFLCWTIT